MLFGNFSWQTNKMRIMRDSTNPYDIPLDGMDIVAGYIDGIYKWPAAGWTRFAGKKIARIACFSTTIAEILDVETGDATPQQAPPWAVLVRHQNIIPTIYCNRSNYLQIHREFVVQNVSQPLYWVATLDGTKWLLIGEVIACQYAGQNQTGGHYDESIVADYWPGVDDMGLTQQEHDWLASVVTALGLGAVDQTKWPVIPLVYNYPKELNDIKTKLAEFESKLTGGLFPK
jgi:hypothetical protein